jgi:excisionase family DNA binding protein
MPEDKFLTVREVAIILGISEREVMDLAENGKIPAYKVGGVYVRFKQHQIEAFKKAKPAQQHHKHKTESSQNSPAQDKLSDFFYFNDFYIMSGVLILAILFFILRG